MMASTDATIRQRFFSGPMFVGLGLTVAFYYVLETASLQGSTVYRYTTGHPIEYATVGIFFWAICDLVAKGLELRRHKSALRHDWLPASASAQPVTAAVELYGQVTSAPRRMLNTYLGRRLRDALYYVREKRSANELEGHLQYLADRDADIAHSGFALVRLAAWMIPILGFLGTVVGITMAIANVTPEQLESSLSEVTGGLGVAFDTTALSLFLSMILMFTSFLTERSEQAVLRQVETRATSELLHRFLAEEPEAGPYLQAVRTASETVIASSNALLQQQINLWTEAIVAQQTQFQDFLRRQDERFQAVFRELRDERNVAESSGRRQVESMAALQNSFLSIVDRLDDICRGEGHLVELQDRLTSNLEAILQTQSLEEAMQSLTAAIHLLTIRQQPRSSNEKHAA